MGGSGGGGRSSTGKLDPELCVGSRSSGVASGPLDQFRAAFPARRVVTKGFDRVARVPVKLRPVTPSWIGSISAGRRLTTIAGRTPWPPSA